MFALRDMVQATEEGDFCFFHYSGHGTFIEDENGDERDGFDEALCALQDEYIRDDELLNMLP